MRVLVFGDSITQGFWDSQGGWAQRLRTHYDKLEMKDFQDKQPTIFNLGISGDVTAGVIKRLTSETEARKWRWPNEQFAFVVAIGINDSALDNGTERSSSDYYLSELQTVLLETKKFSDRILFVGLTPCEEEAANGRPGKTKEYTNERIQEFDKALRQFCSEQKLPYVAVFDALKSKMNAGEHLFDDGLHPNDAGHELIFQLVQPELDKLLKS